MLRSLHDHDFAIGQVPVGAGDGFAEVPHAFLQSRVLHFGDQALAGGVGQVDDALIGGLKIQSTF